MGIDQVRAYLNQWNRDKDIIEMEASTATVPEAAKALGVIPARIAKSISLRRGTFAPAELGGGSRIGENALVVVVAGDMKLDNRKYKDRFGVKVKMLSPEEALAATGHAVGGVCPFALPPGVAVYLDVSMKRFETVYPACGSGNSAIELTMDELNEYSKNNEWVDVCRPIETVEG
jgi:prolyl-tRNA editing enzyme YbaK/EbsC (Cys-tRNA(Pro) deacylase)